MDSLLLGHGFHPPILLYSAGSIMYRELTTGFVSERCVRTAVEQFGGQGPNVGYVTEPFVYKMKGICNIYDLNEVRSKFTDMYIQLLSKFSGVEIQNIQTGF